MRQMKSRGPCLRSCRDSTELVAGLAISDQAPGTMKRILDQAQALANQPIGHHEAHRLICDAIDKVIVHPDSLELHLRKEGLGYLLGVELPSENPIHTVTSPCKLARRGQELKFILPLLGDTNTFGRRDPALIQAASLVGLDQDRRGGIPLRDRQAREHRQSRM